jgi:hypothetical protein
MAERRRQNKEIRPNIEKFTILMTDNHINIRPDGFRSQT